MSSPPALAHTSLEAKLEGVIDAIVAITTTIADCGICGNERNVALRRSINRLEALKSRPLTSEEPVSKKRKLEPEPRAKFMRFKDQALSLSDIEEFSLDGATLVVWYARSNKTFSKQVRFESLAAGSVALDRLVAALHD